MTDDDETFCPEVDEALRQIAADLAKLYSVTVDEAMQRLDRIVNP